MSKKGFIFDMDGVIVDTAKYHFQCWKKVAEDLGLTFTHEDNEQLKGVSRVHSLEIILDMGNLKITQKRKDQILIDKNEMYLDMVRNMNRSEVLPGVKEFIAEARAAGAKIALGSASKNARWILRAADITDWFDAVVDGNDVSKAKPDPEVFIKGAGLIDCEPESCVVFEDSAAGVTAANSANMTSVGIGNQSELPEANYCYRGFDVMPEHFLHTLLNG